MYFNIGITKLEKGSAQYKAATNLIAVGVDFDSTSPMKPGTILYLKDVPRKVPSYDLPKGIWVDTARLDNQGDINRNKYK